MSFLDKINKDTTASKKTNPLAGGKPNPLGKKKIDLKGNPFGKKKEEAPAKEDKKENTKPAKEETKKDDLDAGEEVKATTESSKAQKEESKKEGKAKETKTEEKKEAPKKEDAKADNKEKAEAKEKEEPKKEEKPAPKSSGSKRTSTKKKAAVKKEEKDEPMDVPTIEMPTTSMDYATAVEAISSSFVDEEWIALKEEVIEEMNGVVITADMNSATLKSTLAELSRIRQKIWVAYLETKAIYENLTNKEPEGLIERIKRTAFSSDERNDMERKKAGVLACMNHQSDEGLVNLYEVMDETRTRYMFLKGTMDSIQYKTNSLITMNGALKLEEQHSK